MASYVILMNFTDQGARSASESPKRAAAFKESAAKLGVEVRASTGRSGATTWC
jgi:uncharacterized protein with GYD domain